MFTYLKSEPDYYVIQYVNGEKKRSGIGLAFWYFKPTTTLVKVPVNSVDVPFIFEDVTADYQQITLQGELTFRVAEPEKTAQVLNFTVNESGRFEGDGAQQLSKRLVNQVQMAVQSQLQGLKLAETLKYGDTMSQQIAQRLRESEVTRSLGVDILDLAVLAVKPNPETLRALEAKVREEILKKADEARYDRRNSAVEQERAIKENEFNTEVAIEKKRREVEEEKLDAKKSLQRREAQLRQEQMAEQIELEVKNSELVDLETANNRKVSEAKAFEVEALMQVYEKINPKTLQAMAMSKMDAGRMMAAAFGELAENAGKIGQLNITPDILNLFTREFKK